MKVSLLSTMAITTLLAAGCSQNEITEISPDAAPAVGFSVYATPQVRGAVTDNTAIQTADKGFGVLAYYTKQENFSTNTSSHTPNFMWNQQVKYADGAWGYTPVKYWPNTEGDKISFFAYAPYESSPTGTPASGSGIVLSTATAGSYPTISFTLHQTASKQTDLVATDATQTGDDKTIDLEKTTGKVAFKFKHVLTRLNFKAKLASDLSSLTNSETKVFVKSVQLLGTAAEAPAQENTASQLYAMGTYKFEDGKWDYTSGKATKQSGAITLDGDLFAGTTQSFGTTGSQYTTSSVAIDALGSAVSLFKNNQYLFLIPPTNDGISTAATDVRVLLTYDVVTIDDKLDGKKSVVETKAVASLPLGTMKAGVAYDYTFTIGLESVKVEADVTAWNTPTADVYVPSVTATSNSADNIKTAIGNLSTIKGSNKNCNYFVVKVDGAPASNMDLSGATVSNFVVGDKIEIVYTTAGNVGTITVPSNWSTTATGSVSSVVLVKNK